MGVLDNKPDRWYNFFYYYYTAPYVCIKTRNSDVSMEIYSTIPGIYTPILYTTVGHKGINACRLNFFHAISFFDYTGRFFLSAFAFTALFDAHIMIRSHEPTVFL